MGFGLPWGLQALVRVRGPKNPKPQTLNPQFAKDSQCLDRALPADPLRLHQAGLHEHPTVSWLFLIVANDGRWKSMNTKILRLSGIMTTVREMMDNDNSTNEW